MLQEKVRHIIIRILTRLSGLCLIGFSLLIVLALFSFDVNDPSFNSYSTDEKINNWAGSFGSHIADLLFQLMGLAAFFLCLIIFSIGSKLSSRETLTNILPKIILTPICLLCFSVFFASFPQPSWWEFSSLGGVNGSFILSKIIYVPHFMTLVFSGVISAILISVIIEVSLSDWIYFIRYTIATLGFASRKIYEKLSNIPILKEKLLANKSLLLDRSSAKTKKKIARSANDETTEKCPREQCRIEEKTKKY
jgi:DNA segregation ATPase FtsK/SpoIIIE-like protein